MKRILLGALLVVVCLSCSGCLIVAAVVSFGAVTASTVKTDANKPVKGPTVRSEQAAAQPLSGDETKTP